MSQADPATEGRPTHQPYPRRWAALALVGVAQFMLILDITVVAIAMPQLGADLGMSRDALTWVMSAYTLTFGGLMLTGGRLADVVGPRRIVLIGLAIFTVASLAAGLADNAALVLAARVAQGVGAALMSPAALSTVVRLFAGEELNRALGIWSALGGVGAAVGVLVGGVLTAGPGWPWVFLVNVPIGAVILIVLPAVLPALPPLSAWARLDLVGALLGTLAFGSVIFACIDAGNTGIASPRPLGALAVSLLLFLALGAWLRRHPQPLVDPALVARRPVLAGSIVLFVGTGLMVAVFFLGTFYLQAAAGYDALTTGLLFLPVAVATMGGAQTAGRAIGPLGVRTVAVIGLLLAGAGLAVAALGSGTTTVMVATSVGSAGLGALFVVASVTVLSSVAHAEAGIASGLLSSFHELGAALGAALMSGVAAASLTGTTAVGFQRGYAVAAGIALVAAVLAWVLLRPSAPPQEDTTP